MSPFTTPDQDAELAAVQANTHDLDERLRAELAQATADLKAAVDVATSTKRVVNLIDALRRLGTYPQPNAVLGDDSSGIKR